MSEQQPIAERTDLNLETKIETEPTDGNGDTEDLRTEVAKWQERVPKLTSALRERTGELARARRNSAAETAK